MTAPPKRKEDQPRRVVLRIMVLVVLLGGVAVLVWNATTQQRIDLTETGSVAALNLDPEVLMTVEGLTIYVAERTEGDVPIILLHDVDVAGSVVLDDLVETIGDRARVVTIDLPGFGLSSRVPERGPAHTVAGMSRVVAAVIEERFGGSAVVVGVGLGGEVAAEVAATRTDLVAGLVMIDVDLWRRDSWRERSQRLPWIGRSMTYTYETSGRSSARTWAPYCRRGGWCPSRGDQTLREVTATIANSTDSINAFRNTLRSSFIPDDLNLIVAPSIYIWSLDGPVPEDSVERMRAAISDLRVVRVEVFQSHLEAVDALADIIVSLVDD